MGLFAQRAVEVGAQGDPLVGQLGVLARLVGAGLDDLLLLVGDLQGVGRRVVAVGHQVRQGQHGADQDLLVVLAGVGRTWCRR